MKHMVKLFHEWKNGTQQVSQHVNTFLFLDSMAWQLLNFVLTHFISTLKLC